MRHGGVRGDFDGNQPITGRSVSSQGSGCNSLLNHSPNRISGPIQYTTSAISSLPLTLTTLSLSYTQQLVYRQMASITRLPNISRILLYPSVMAHTLRTYQHNHCHLLVSAPQRALTLTTMLTDINIFTANRSPIYSIMLLRAHVPPPPCYNSKALPFHHHSRKPHSLPS